MLATRCCPPGSGLVRVFRSLEPAYLRQCAESIFPQPTRVSPPTHYSCQTFTIVFRTLILYDRPLVNPIEDVASGVGHPTQVRFLLRS
jgi:hypothetical protein